MWGKYPLGGVKCEMNYQSDVFQNPTTFPLISDRYDWSSGPMDENGHDRDNFCIKSTRIRFNSIKFGTSLKAALSILTSI